MKKKEYVNIYATHIDKNFGVWKYFDTVPKKEVKKFIKGIRKISTSLWLITEEDLKFQEAKKKAGLRIDIPLLYVEW